VRPDSDVGAGRDRVLDLTKSFALLVVVVAHALAWDVSTGTPASILDLRPELSWVTWLLQVLPLFFAAGAVSNLASWGRHHDPKTFWRRRVSRLATPAVLYALVWSAVLLPVAVFFTPVEMVGRYLAQLLWFLGVYSAAVIAVPLTARWAGRPLLTLSLWLAVILAVDLVRWQVAPTVGWFNMLLVWAWLHQLGYSLPALRSRPTSALVTGGAFALALAVVVAAVGPYSTSMVSTAGDPGLSNLSPPTVVLALYGLAQVLMLAALWPALERLMAWRPAWMAVAVFGSRAVEVYLWHIPLVGSVIAIAWISGWAPGPLSGAWWALHVTVAALVVPLAWWVAGPAGWAARRLAERAAATPPGRGRRPQSPRHSGTLPACLVVSLSIMALSQTGVATWWGDGLLGMPMSTVVLVAALVGGWWVLVASAPGVGTHDVRGLSGGDVADLPRGDTSVGQ
jgi:hypothetical protein